MSGRLPSAWPEGDDLFFIFPDHTQYWQRGQAIRPVTRLAMDRSIELGVEKALEDEWLNAPRSADHS